MRTESFSAKVSERLGPLAGLLTKIIMNHSLLHGKALQMVSTEPLTLQQILAMLPSNSSMDYQKLGSVLDQMSNDQMKAVRKSKQSDGEPRYSISMAHILRYIQLRLVENLISKNFGDQAHVRVFRAIQALTMANDKQLEESCLLSVKVVRRILMDLVVFGVVEQHEINATKGLYAYSVKVAGYLPLLRDRIFKSKLNLEIKIDEQRELLSKLTKAQSSSQDELKQQTHMLKKLTLASYQMDNMITHFLLF